jgi:hypothetical protein
MPGNHPRHLMAVFYFTWLACPRNFFWQLLGGNASLNIIRIHIMVMQVSNRITLANTPVAALQ